MKIKTAQAEAYATEELGNAIEEVVTRSTMANLPVF
jgi:hypothetical protein